MVNAAVIDERGFPDPVRVELRRDHLDWSAREASLLRRIVYRLTPRRGWNSLLNERERRSGRLQLRSLPPLLYFDVTNVCNLRCPLCPTGRSLPGYPKGFMSLELFRTILDELGEHALCAGLYNWGEPLLHPDLLSMIEAAHAKGLATHLSTNLNTPSEDRLRALLASPLDQLVVSCDGVDEVSYGCYRRGGSFARVMENLRFLLAHRRGRRPAIIWQYLVMRHNERGMQRARELAAELGVDLLQFAPLNLCDVPFVGRVDAALADEWLPANRAVRPAYEHAALSPDPCPYLWRMAFFSHDGSVNPCCDVFDQRHAFGKIDATHRFAEIWNNPRFLSARARFAGARAGAPTICDACRQFTPRSTP
jgi:MoaA/NifB/PqqE/SkfB family radical SAM enzyme